MYIKQIVLKGAPSDLNNPFGAGKYFFTASKAIFAWSGIVDERITKSMIVEYQGKVMHFVMAELTSLRVIKQSPLTLEYAISVSHGYFDPSHKFSAIADIYGMNSTMWCIGLERVQE